jgi:hypothetical protein
LCTRKFQVTSSVDFLFLTLFVLLQDHPSLVSRPPLPKEGLFVKEPASSDLEAPETVEKQDKDEVKNSSEGTDSNHSPPADSEGEDGGRKRKCQEYLISSSTSKSKDIPHQQATSSTPPLASFLLAMSGSDSRVYFSYSKFFLSLSLTHLTSLISN